MITECGLILVFRYLQPDPTWHPYVNWANSKYLRNSYALQPSNELLSYEAKNIVNII